MYVLGRRDDRLRHVHHPGGGRSQRSRRRRVVAALRTRGTRQRGHGTPGKAFHLIIINISVISPC